MEALNSIWEIQDQWTGLIQNSGNAKKRGVLTRSLCLYEALLILY